MLTMIIADDEILVREGLKNILPWEDYKIKIVASTKNGMETLHACQELKPDILFTDIRMPHLSGIQVAQKLSQQNSKTRIIIISGIEDFSYAQQAIELNAEGYLLKPIKKKKLIEIVENVVKAIHDEKEHAVKFKELKNQLYSHMPAIKERFLSNIVFRKYSNEKTIYDKCDFLNIPFTHSNPYILCKMVIDEIDIIFSQNNEENYELILMSIINIINEILTNYSQGICFNQNESEFIIIFNYDNMNDINRICEDILTSLNHYIQIKVSIGIGKKVESILSLFDSYKSAETSLEYKFYSGINTIINAEDLSYKPVSLEYVQLHVIGEKLINGIKIGNLTTVNDVLSEIFAYIESSSYKTEEYTKNIFTELIFITARSLYEIQEQMNNIVGEPIHLSNFIYQLDTYDDLKIYIIKLFEEITAYFSHKVNQKNTYVINQVREIIRQQYTNNLTVKLISDQIGLTPNYISQIFKKDTGLTITKYLTDVRINAAKELLKDSNFKVFEVAEMVGFDNPYYFSTVFKKVTGMHPSKFR
ncbi:response regulator [Vallitalea maricola]|uniref:Uncharacterized protein n=1 Tax=Vallitalea maricola TaxID=3074433 RepID=A0ACB5UEH7_9FIRM|nr:hypothetical protein AN2V17_05740 [Vallitalea sp. AN17-2]